jgi:Mn2+/Fe2+ NRAMP family transporter
MLLLTGSYQRITRVLTFLVVSMSLAFLVNAFLSTPDWAAMIEGFVPTISEGNIITTVALVGTTVVPYNLFLHSSLVTQRWKDISGLKYARIDTCIAVIIGGLVSMAIVVTGVKGQSLQVTQAADLALGLEPLMGAYAKYFMAFGLFAAGLTSAMTAPLAGALVIAGCFGWSTALHSRSMKWSVSLILGLGLLFSLLGIKPVQLITIAQLANGILLPLLSAYVIWIINKKSLMGRHTNSLTVNVLTWVVWLITLGLGWLSIYKVLGSNWLI